MTARFARVIAVVIAFAALVDPSWMATTRVRAAVAVVEPEGSRIGERLARDYRVVRAYDGADVLVVVGRTYPVETVPPSARVATVTLPESLPAVHLVDVQAPAMAPAATAIHLDATIAAGSARPLQSTVVARIGGIEVGRAQHTWTASDDRWRAGIDVVPVGEPPWVVSVGAAESMTSVLVDRAPRIPVTFYEPRPSWATTFARRAIEGDPRFAVQAVTQLGDTAAPTIVVGGLDRVTDADVAALDHFVRDRGGAVVVLPDERIADASPVARLLLSRGDEREMLLDRPALLAAQAPLPRFGASELITFAGVGGDAEVLARTADAARPVVWVARRGEGRVVVSGALDAWRFRAADDAAFDRFWRAAISGAALTTPPLVDVSVSPAVAHPLDTIHVHARVHRSIAANALSVSASLASGDVVRLWPDAERGSFSGAFVASGRAGVSRVSVAATTPMTRAAGSTAFAISSTLAPDTLAPGTLVPGTLTPAPPLALLSATRGGIDVTASDLAPLDRWLRATVAAPDKRAVRHPMRSPWWMLPFFVCLTIDWWITSSRRRRR